MSFRIRKGFLIPLALLTLEIAALMASCIILKQPPAKVIILGVMSLPVLILLVECAFRQTVIDDEAITARKFLRRKRLRFADITAVDTLQIKKRAFITLAADDNFLILSNAYADFPQMLNEVIARCPAEAITEETVALAQNPPTKSTDILSCWLAVILLGFILYSQIHMMT